MANRYRMVDDKLVQLTDEEEAIKQTEEAANTKAIGEELQLGK